MLESQLKTIGLSEKEAKVYLAVLELGPSTAQQISQKAEVNRASVYVQIEFLTERGLMSSYEKGKKTFFVAESPEYLSKVVQEEKSKIEAKEQTLKEIFPELKNLFDYAGDRPKVRFFEGKEGLKTMQEDFLKTKDKKIEAIFNHNILDKIFSDDESRLFFKQRIKKKIFTKSLYVRSEGKLNVNGQFTKRYYIPFEKFPISSDITIYENKIALVAFDKKPFGVIIESKEITNTIRSIFNLAWETAEKYNK